MHFLDPLLPHIQRGYRLTVRRTTVQERSRHYSPHRWHCCSSSRMACCSRWLLVGHGGTMQKDASITILSKVCARTVRACFHARCYRIFHGSSLRHMCTSILMLRLWRYLATFCRFCRGCRLYNAHVHVSGADGGRRLHEGPRRRARDLAIADKCVTVGEHDSHKNA